MHLVNLKMCTHNHGQEMWLSETPLFHTTISFMCEQQRLWQDSADVQPPESCNGKNPFHADRLN